MFTTLFPELSQNLEHADLDISTNLFSYSWYHQV